MTFDLVLPKLLALCMAHDLPRYANRVGVIRDVRGRVRVVLDPIPRMDQSFSSLETALTESLDQYFVGPILLTAGAGERERLAKALLDKATSNGWPGSWPRAYLDPLGIEVNLEQLGSLWIGLERTIGKEAWLSRPAHPPWPLVRGKTPPIVAFHSFKGGVGRSTLLAAYAISLAARGKRIAIVDLDLEAPGVGALLGATSPRGVLDVLVDRLATGRITLEGAKVRANLEHPVGDQIIVLPAGLLGRDFLSKLARLDFSTRAPGEPNIVAIATQECLEELKREGFDLILLDARAGLHDLAGMAVQRLSHVNVLVFRGTEQHLIGLETTLDIMGLEPEARLVLVETMLPAREAETALWRQKTRERVHDAMCRFVYEAPPPQLEDRDAAHHVSHVTRKEWLEALDSFTGRVDSTLSDPDLQALFERIDGAANLAEDDGDEEQVDGT